VPLPEAIPPDLAGIIAKAGLADLDWPAQFQADTISEADNRAIRKLARANPRNHRLFALLRLAVPQHWVRCGDYDMLVCPRDNHTDFVIWMHGHPPEPSSIAALTAAVVEQACLILDIGANSGTYTVPLADKAALGSTVLAFEPNPVMADRLRQNIEKNRVSDRVVLNQVAISYRDGEADLHLPGTNFGEASLNLQPDSDGPAIPVKVALLQDFISPTETRPVVIKIDIEGYEDRALVPFLKTCAEDNLPTVMLIETRHRRKWRLDLTGHLKRRNYHSVLSMEGNTLYLRGG
jgi:FkbM family methyltransferase